MALHNLAISVVGSAGELFNLDETTQLIERIPHGHLLLPYTLRSALLLLRVTVLPRLLSQWL